VSNKTVETGNKVKVHYKGTFDDGTVFDSSYDRGTPIDVEVGAGQVIAGFDAALTGMKTGDTKTINLLPEQAYGERNLEAIVEVSKENFPENFVFTQGEVIQGTNEAGFPLVGTLQEDKGEAVVVDFNHPMAGKTLNFAIEVVDIE
jgi:peptidylprolyl isomerase